MLEIKRARGTFCLNQKSHHAYPGNSAIPNRLGRHKPYTQMERGFRATRVTGKYHRHYSCTLSNRNKRVQPFKYLSKDDLRGKSGAIIQGIGCHLL